MTVSWTILVFGLDRSKNLIENTVSDVETIVPSQNLVAFCQVRKRKADC